MSREQFDREFEAIDTIGGWLTADQAFRLHQAVKDLPADSTVVEIGSHQGRSTVVLARARRDVTVVAVDPFVDGWKFGGAATRRVFEQNLEAYGVADRVRLVAEPAERLRARWSGPVHLVYVDGKHDALSAARDLRWAEFLPEGGRVFVHDAFSSIGVTLAVLGRVLPSTRLRYVGRTGSLAELVRDSPTVASRAAIVRELPWWLRNVWIKVLLRLRARGLAARWGHHDRWDPY